MLDLKRPHFQFSNSDLIAAYIENIITITRCICLYMVRLNSILCSNQKMLIECSHNILSDVAHAASNPLGINFNHKLRNKCV